LNKFANDGNFLDLFQKMKESGEIKLPESKPHNNNESDSDKSSESEDTKKNESIPVKDGSGNIKK